MKSRVVFDCVVCLQGAARESGPAGACFHLLKTGQFTVHVSAFILEELADVLNRPKSRQRFKTLTPERVEAFLRELQNLAVLVDPVPAVFAYARDPDDEPYVNVTVAAGASYLVTWDKDLLDLMADNADGRDFRTRFPQLRILTPVEFLREHSPPPLQAEVSSESDELPGDSAAESVSGDDS